MKIVVVIDSLDLSTGGGAGTFVFDLCNGLAKNNSICLVGVVTALNDCDPFVLQLQRCGVKTVCLGAKSRKKALGGFNKYILRLRQEVESFSDGEKCIINVHLKMGVLYGAIAKIGLRNCVCVETYHNTYHHYWLQCTVLRPIIKKYICVSDTAREEMHRRFSIPYNKLVTIPNGVDRVYLRQQVKENTLERNEDKIYVLSVGRLSYEKNILTAIKAVSSLQNYKIVYDVIGNGPQLEAAKRIAGYNTIIHGQLDRLTVLQYINRANIIVMPSLWEGRSIFMLESAAFDKPFVISDCAGLREPFMENELRADEKMRCCSFGYLVRTNYTDGYKKAIEHFINHKLEWGNMADRVKQMSIQNDMSNVIEHYCKIFREI